MPGSAAPAVGLLASKSVTAAAAADANAMHLRRAR
jgi:hypothetical protein